jgi:hypothetical protein
MICFDRLVFKTNLTFSKGHFMIPFRHAVLIGTLLVNAPAFAKNHKNRNQDDDNQPVPAAVVVVVPVQQPQPQQQPKPQPAPARPVAPVAPVQPQQPQQPVQQPTPAPEFSQERINQLARSEARSFANKVVNTYGKIENYRYNFYRGFKLGVGLYDLSNIAGVQATPEFQSGYAQGLGSGQSQGSTAGAQQGAADGRAYGGGAADSLYENAVNKQGSVDASLPAMNTPAPTINVPAVQVDSMDARFAKLDAQLTAELRDYQANDEDMYFRYSEWDHQISMSTLYSWNDYQFDTVQSWYRDQWALQLYQQRALGGRDKVAYYQRICQQSVADCQNFDMIFKQTYNETIDKSWRRVVSQDNIDAHDRGIVYGNLEARQQVKDMGVSAGYKSGYLASASQSYAYSFQASYANAFNSTVQYYESNAKLEGASVSVSDAQGGGNFVVGQPVIVTVKSLRNAGRQNAKVSIAISGAATQVKSYSFDLAYSSTLQTQVRAAGIAVVNLSEALDQNSAFNVYVGGQSLTVNFSLKMENQVRGFVNTRDLRIKEYIRQVLAKEWNDVSSTFSGNKFDGDNVNDTYLEQLVSVARQLNPDQRAFLKAQTKEFVAVYGERPGVFSFRERKKWDTAVGLLKSM